MSEQKPSGGVQIVDVDASRAGQRLDNFLASRFPGVPRSLVYRIIRTGQVRVNGGRAKPMQKLRAGDRVRIPPVKVQRNGPPRVPDRVVRSLEQGLLYEDDDLLVVDKPAGMAVHSGSGVDWGVVDALRQSRPNEDIDLVHRLDRDTSGVLVLARNRPALLRLQEQFKQRTVTKRYFTLLQGHLSEDRVVVDQPLGRRERGGERMIEVDRDGKPAVTEFRRIEVHGAATLVEARPITGRTHQIRAHAVFLDAPCAGDARYLDRDSLKAWRDRGLERLFLHATALEIPDAREGTRIFSSPLPPDLRRVLDRL